MSATPKSDSPRTDAASRGADFYTADQPAFAVVVPVDFARSLERELSEVTRERGQTQEKGDCRHEWVSAVNRVVQNGEICIRCQAIRVEATNTPTCDLLEGALAMAPGHAFQDRDSWKKAARGFESKLIAAERELVELRGKLELMYDKWENGVPCHEDPESQSGFVGNAFTLTDEEERGILALLPPVGQQAPEA